MSRRRQAWKIMDSLWKYLHVPSRGLCCLLWGPHRHNSCHRLLSLVEIFGVKVCTCNFLEVCGAWPNQFPHPWPPSVRLFLPLEGEPKEEVKEHKGGMNIIKIDYIHVCKCHNGNALLCISNIYLELAAKPDHLSSVPQTHRVEGGNQFQQVVLCPPHMHHHICARTPSLTELNECIRLIYRIQNVIQIQAVFFLTISRKIISNILSWNMLLWIDSFLILSPSCIRWWKHVNSFIKANLTDVAKHWAKFSYFKIKSIACLKTTKKR